MMFAIYHAKFTVLYSIIMRVEAQGMLVRVGASRVGYRLTDEQNWFVH
jgi:hypothetical protein